MAPPGVGAGGDDFDSDVMIGEVDIDVKSDDFESGGRLAARSVVRYLKAQKAIVIRDSH